jgi:voltage-gated potassium channel Kch
MNGTRIRATGQPDAAAVADYQERLIDRPNRELVVLVPLLAWLAIAGTVAMARGERAARVALPVVGLACAWGPTLLLVAAALDAATLASTLIVGLGALALAAATALLLPGYRGLALVCGVAVAAHAADVVAGSPLIALSVLGPNPSGGVRFFGIGNEHAATLTPLALIGTGAWLATRDVSPRSAAWWFVAVALLAAAAYTPGRFGASVGTAIMLAAGSGTAAALAVGMPARRVALAIGGAIAAGLAILSTVDLVTGDAHLTRTILGAGETSELLDAFERRLRLMVGTFTSPVYPQLFGATVVLLIVGLVHRASILAWFGNRQPARAGFLGALAAVVVGSVANDSGSVLLVIGMVYLAACAGFFWGTGPEAPRDRPVGSNGRLRDGKRPYA